MKYVKQNRIQTGIHLGDVNFNQNMVISLDDYIFQLECSQPKTRDFFARFMYDTCAAEFVGRDKELQLLEDFLCADDRILWWAITGSAGKGKTRLTYEFLNKINKNRNWIARFIRWQTFSEDLKQIEFTYDNVSKNLLIIFDYVYAYQNDIAKWVEVLVNEYKSCCKVRILLIEREDEKVDSYGKRRIAPWEEMFLVATDSPTLMMRIKYQRENLNLNYVNLTKEDAINIAKSYCKNLDRELSAQKLDRIILAAQKSNNNMYSPLQILLLTEYYTGPRSSNFSENIYQTVLSTLVNREFNILYGTLELNNRIQLNVLKHIMVLATIMGRVSTDTLLSKAFLGIIGNMAQLQEVVETLQESVLSVYDKQGQYFIQGIQPDLIGEYYVYTIFEEMSDKRISEMLDCIHSYAPAELSRFLLRFMEDAKEYHFGNSSIELLAKYLPEEDYIFTVMNDHGETVTCEVLFTFESETTGKDYIVYTDNTTDKDGNTRVYASIYDADRDQSRLFPIETQNEWRTIEIILEEIRDSLDEDDIEQVVGRRLLEEKLDGV